MLRHPADVAGDAGQHGQQRDDREQPRARCGSDADSAASPARHHGVVVGVRAAHSSTAGRAARGPSFKSLCGVPGGITTQSPAATVRLVVAEAHAAARRRRSSRTPRRGGGSARRSRPRARRSPRRGSGAAPRSRPARRARGSWTRRRDERLQLVRLAFSITTSPTRVNSPVSMSRAGLALAATAGEFDPSSRRRAVPAAWSWRLAGAPTRFPYGGPERRLSRGGPGT